MFSNPRFWSAPFYGSLGKWNNPAQLLFEMSTPENTGGRCYNTVQERLGRWPLGVTPMSYWFHRGRDGSLIQESPEIFGFFLLNFIVSYYIEELAL